MLTLDISVRYYQERIFEAGDAFHHQQPLHHCPLLSGLGLQSVVFSIRLFLAFKEEASCRRIPTFRFKLIIFLGLSLVWWDNTHVLPTSVYSTSVLEIT